MFQIAKSLISEGYEIVYNHGTKIPKTYVCPKCLEQMKQYTDHVVLQRRAAKNIVIGTRVEDGISFKIAVCSKCEFTRTN